MRTFGEGNDKCDPLAILTIECTTLGTNLLLRLGTHRRAFRHVTPSRSRLGGGYWTLYPASIVTEEFASHRLPRLRRLTTVCALEGDHVSSDFAETRGQPLRALKERLLGTGCADDSPCPAQVPQVLALLWSRGAGAEGKTWKLQRGQPESSVGCEV